MPTLEVFFDCVSPWSYLAFHNARKVCEKLNLPINWRPVFLDGLFIQMMTIENYDIQNLMPRKRAYYTKDLADCALFSGITINYPPKFEVNTGKCMRACLFLKPQGKTADFAAAAYRSFWEDGLDLGDDEVVVDICRQIGVDPDRVMTGIASAAIKSALDASLQELIKRGGFGVPTFFVNGDDIYFGNDNLVLVEFALQRSIAANATNG